MLEGAITQLEAITFPTKIFSSTIEIPNSDYDQQAARQLMLFWRTQIESDTLTPEQFDALTRFALVEQAMVDSRLAYAEIAAKMADLSVDVTKIPLEIRGVLKQVRLPVRDACKLSPKICTEVLKEIDDLTWRVVEQAKQPLLHVLPSDQREKASDFYDLAIAAERTRLTGSRDSLLEWFLDRGLTSTATAMLVKFHYQPVTQPVIAKSARTADLSAASADRWPITGALNWAENQLQLQVKHSQIDRDFVVADHEDTTLRTDNLKLAETVAALGTLSPFVVYAKATELSIKAGRGIAELWIITKRYAPRINCVVYRSKRLGELSFNATPMLQTCPMDETAGVPSGPTSTFLVAYHPVPHLSSLHLRFLDASDQYRQAVQQLTQAVQARDVAQIETALTQLLAVSDAQQANIQTVGALLLAHETLSPDDLALLQQQDSLTANALALYLSTLETVAAQQANLAPQTDLTQIAQATLATVDQIEQIIPKVDLAPPTEHPLVLIRGVQTRVVGQQLQLEVTLANVGGVAVPDLRVDVAADGGAAVAPVLVGDLPLGGEQHATVLMPLPQAQSVVVRALHQETTLDTYLADVPETAPNDSAAANLAPSPVPTTGPVEAAAPASTNQPIILIGALMALLVLGLGGFWLVRRSAR